MMLETRAGLTQIISCMSGNIPLHGISDENCGIRECRSLYVEFQKGKHGSNAEQTAGGQGNVTETEKATAESQDSKAHAQ
jgi:hypothetical protein